MRFLKEYRDGNLAREILGEIKKISLKPAKLMEVCGTHTVSIFRHGIRDILPENINLISGPGCPVCVTPNKHIDEAIELCRRPDVVLTTFGDMMKVPGSGSSLAAEKAEGADIRIVYSTMDAVDIARDNPDREVVFFGIGFETTSPTIAAAVLRAEREGVSNFSIVGAQKLIPEAIRALLENNEVGVNGFILPGHVSALIGIEPYRFIASEFGIPAVIIGFEPVDILQGIHMLVKQIEAGEARTEIQYTRGVPPGGNPHAMKILFSVFEPGDALWRGIGSIPGTGLKLKKEYRRFDAVGRFGIEITGDREHPGCRCGDVLRGVKTPLDCGLYGKACIPENPVGPCMVSVEGTCAAYYKYGMRRSG
ncbi:MAG: hydrogenase formation protein HypD [Firmicutes bacterium HGW-Firmicutes-14]|nr:MAG: hydrogenase formation protein HypD [Firmicutes bacterium HGW-Firmicutes-14]